MAYVSPVWNNDSIPPIDADNLNDLSTAVENLQVENGGTGVTTLDEGGVLLGNGTSAVQTLVGTGAFFATSNGNPQFGTLPISCGGTGATTQDAARAALGLTNSRYVVQTSQPTDTTVLWIDPTDSTMSYYYEGEWHKICGVFA